MIIRYTTIIQQKQPSGKWFFYGQQSIGSDELGLSDEEYLRACQDLPDCGELRIAPRQGYQVHAGSLEREED
jgi:hypothetical protein